MISIKKEKNCANVTTKPIVASELLCCSNCKIGILRYHGSHTPEQDDGDKSDDKSVLASTDLICRFTHLT